MSRISVLDHGAVGDGVADDSAAIQNVISNIATSFDIIEFSAGYVFKIGQLMIPSNRILEAYGAVFHVKVTTPFAWGFRTQPGAQYIQFRGGEIIGNDVILTGYQWQQGIFIDQAQNVLIQGVTSSDNKFDGLSIGGNPGVPSRLIKIVDCIFSTNHRNGASVTFADGVEFIDCQFKDNISPLLGAGLDVEPNAEGQVHNISVINCLAENNNIGFYDHSNASSIHGSGRTYVNCISTLNKKYGYVNNKNSNIKYIDCEASENGSELANGGGLSIGNDSVDVNIFSMTLGGNRSGRGMIFAGARSVRVLDSELMGDKIIQIPGTWGSGIDEEIVFLGNA